MPLVLLLAPLLAPLFAPLLASLLAPLLALCNFCHGLALWGGVSQAFWAACSYPFFGSFFLKLHLASWTLIYDSCLALWDSVSQAFWASCPYPSFESFLPKFPLAPWTLIYDNCLALRNGMSQAFWAAWTYPSFESFLPKLLPAPWTLIYDNCLVLRDSVSQTFWASWTYPSFESFLPKLPAPWTLICDIRVARWDTVSQAFWPFGRPGTNLQQRGSITHADHHDNEEHHPHIEQSDKPRAGIAAEYLAHGHQFSEDILKRAIEIDNKHGISKSFLSSMSGLDKSVGQKTLGPDQTISGKIQSTFKEAHMRVKSIDEQKGHSKVAREYYKKALTSPFGQKVLSFYTSTSKQVRDIHEEALRIKAANAHASTQRGTATSRSPPAPIPASPPAQAESSK